MSEYRGRYCSNFYCDRHRERRCCADCWHKKHHKCKNPCLNDPSRCGMECPPPKRHNRPKKEDKNG